MYLEYDYLYTGCPTKHARWWIVLNVFFHYSLSRLIPKTIKKYYMESYYSKINFKVKYIWAKYLFTRNKLQTAFSIWYSVLKTTFRTIYQQSCFLGHIYLTQSSTKFQFCCIYISKDNQFTTELQIYTLKWFMLSHLRLTPTEVIYKN